MAEINRAALVREVEKLCGDVPNVAEVVAVTLGLLYEVHLRAGLEYVNSLTCREWHTVQGDLSMGLAEAGERLCSPPTTRKRVKK